jgi:hypothetical protein
MLRIYIANIAVARIEKPSMRKFTKESNDIKRGSRKETKGKIQNVRTSSKATEISIYQVKEAICMENIGISLKCPKLSP